jgi:hypothetical protein
MRASFKSSSKGYIYCFSNKVMPGILKIGMTRRCPAQRLKEANQSDTWRPPTQYTIEFAKVVNEPLSKEKDLHHLLERTNERIHPNREFFRAEVDEIKKLFSIMDGEWWEKKNYNNQSSEKMECNKPECITPERIAIRTRVYLDRGVKIHSYKRVVIKK